MHKVAGYKDLLKDVVFPQTELFTQKYRHSFVSNLEDLKELVVEYHQLLYLRDYLPINRSNGASKYAADATQKVSIFSSATFIVEKSIVMTK